MEIVISKLKNIKNLFCISGRALICCKGKCWKNTIMKILKFWGMTKNSNWPMPLKIMRLLSSEDYGNWSPQSWESFNLNLEELIMSLEPQNLIWMCFWKKTKTGIIYQNTSSSLGRSLGQISAPIQKEFCAFSSKLNLGSPSMISNWQGNAGRKVSDIFRSIRASIKPRPWEWRKKDQRTGSSTKETGYQGTQGAILK